LNDRKKPLLWFMILILIMSCAPAAVTPIPTLNPTAINLFIWQTAQVASIQTQAAIPPTATFTPTLRSTFTPESTYTTVPAFSFPTPTPLVRSQFFRIKHDSQLPEYNYRSRTAADGWTGVGRQTPEIARLLVAPKAGAGTNRTKLNNNWEIYLDSLNNNDQKKLGYLKSNNTALFNGAGFPQLESLTMGGNIISISEVQGNWGRVYTLDYSSPGSLKDINYYTRPDLVHKFVVVVWKNDTRTTFWVNSPKGALYWPLVSNRPIWINLDQLEPFPTIPMTVTINTPQKPRVNPVLSSPFSGAELNKGDMARIVEYFPSGSNVWARLEGGGWIALLLYQGGGVQYLTDWSMATVPPPPG